MPQTNASNNQSALPFFFEYMKLISLSPEESCCLHPNRWLRFVVGNLQLVLTQRSWNRIRAVNFIRNCQKTDTGHMIQALAHRRIYLLAFLLHLSSCNKLESSKRISHAHNVPKSNVPRYFLTYMSEIYERQCIQFCNLLYSVVWPAQLGDDSGPHISTTHKATPHICQEVAPQANLYYAATQNNIIYVSDILYFRSRRRRQPAIYISVQEFLALLLLLLLLQWTLLPSLPPFLRFWPFLPTCANPSSRL